SGTTALLGGEFFALAATAVTASATPAASTVPALAFAGAGTLPGSLAGSLPLFQVFTRRPFIAGTGKLILFILGPVVGHGGGGLLRRWPLRRTLGRTLLRLLPRWLILRFVLRLLRPALRMRLLRLALLRPCATTSTASATAATFAPATAASAAPSPT